MLNGKGEKRHEVHVSRDTLNGQRLWKIFNISYIQNHLLPYEISIGLFCSPENIIQSYVSVHV